MQKTGGLTDSLTHASSGTQDGWPRLTGFDGSLTGQTIIVWAITHPSKHRVTIFNRGSGKGCAH